MKPTKAEGTLGLITTISWTQTKGLGVWPSGPGETLQTHSYHTLLQPAQGPRPIADL